MEYGIYFQTRNNWSTLIHRYVFSTYKYDIYFKTTRNHCSVLLYTSIFDICVVAQENPWEVAHSRSKYIIKSPVVHFDIFVLHYD